MKRPDIRCELGVPRGGNDGMLLSSVTELAVVLALAGAFCAILDTLETLELEMLGEAAEARSRRAVKARSSTWTSSIKDARPIMPKSGSSGTGTGD